MRVLTIVDSLMVAGAEALVRETVPRIRSRGIDVTLAVLKELPNSPFERELRELGFRFLRTAPGGVYSPDHVFSLSREIDSFDVVHVRLFPALLWAPIAKKLARSRLPMVMSADATSTNREKLPFNRPFEQWMHSQYAAILAASEGIAGYLKRLVPKCADRIQVVWNGVDVERFRRARPLKRKQLFDNDDSILIYTARFDIVKDHQNLLRAIAKVPNANLLLVGDGELRGQAEALAKSLGVESRIRFLGQRQDVPELLKTADLYVHPAYSEGFGLAAIEAMAAGLPVIASDIPGLAQVVGDAGVLVPPRDPDALAQAIQHVLASAEQRSTLSLRSLRRAADFDIERTVEGYVKTYEDVLALTSR